ncbi:hypothetical protein Hanom_Chr12g01143351 [Helianthus anomalus]
MCRLVLLSASLLPFANESVLPLCNVLTCSSKEALFVSFRCIAVSFSLLSSKPVVWLAPVGAAKIFI